MSVKDYIYLPGGNPSDAFTEAAQAITRRAMRYMGKYNELYRRSSGPYKSVARGLSRELNVPVKTDNLFFAHGVKEAMQFSARYINWLSRDLQNKIRATGQSPPKFKFLVRTPSYQPIIAAFQGYASFDCQLVSSFDSVDTEGRGHFNHLNLMEDISPPNFGGSRTAFEYIIGYLDINSCNPSGYVRGEAETRQAALALSVMRLSNKYYLHKVLGPISFKREPFVLVEDHIYRGLEYGDAKTVSFCQMGQSLTKEFVFKDVTHTIFGVAKYGLVGMRGSVTVAPAFDITLMQRDFEQRNSDISPFSVLACQYMFGDNKDDKASREKYLKKKTREYERNALIAAAIIDGKAQDFLSPPEYDTAAGWLVKHGNLKETEAHQLLEEGIKGIDVVNLPRSGFFLLLNYEKMIQYADDEYDFLPENIIKFIRGAAHYRFAMNIGDSEYMGMNNDLNAVMRLTVAITPAELTKRLLRLRQLGDFMEKVGPLNSHRVPDPEGIVMVRASKPLKGFRLGKPIVL